MRSIPSEQRFVFNGRSNISVQHRNSANHGPKTRFSYVRGRTRKLRGSISSQKGLRKLQLSGTQALILQAEPAMCDPKHKSES